MWRMLLSRATDLQVTLDEASADAEGGKARWTARYTFSRTGRPVVNQVRAGGLGYNAQTNKFEDLLAAGVVDPAKVTRSALQNAASIAGLVLTTEALIADKPEKGSLAPAGGGGGMPGGMGGMGGMGGGMGF